MNEQKKPGDSEEARIGMSRGAGWPAGEGEGIGLDLTSLVRDLASAGVDPAADDGQALASFIEARQRADDDPRERQRIRDIGDLIDAEDAIYAQAVAAVDRGDLEAAEGLLRSSAQAGIGDSAFLLASVLEQRGSTQEALLWYRRAAIDGDPRADDKIAGLHARPEPAPASEPGSSNMTRLYYLRGSMTRNTDTKSEYAIDVRPGPLTGSWFLLNEALCLFCSSSSTQDRVTPPRYRPRDLDGSFVIGYAKYPGLHLSALRDKLSFWATERVPLPVEFLDRGLWARPAISLGWRDGWLSREWRRSVSAVGRVPREPAAADLALPLASVPAIVPWATLSEAMDQMLESEIQAMPVTEDASVVGVVTLTDLAQAMRRTRGLPSIQQVNTLMRTPVTVPAATPASAVMATAASSQAGLLVVIGPDGTPFGYLTPESLLTGVPVPAGTREQATPSRSLLLIPELLEA
jgi:CBS domain-containing protein